MERQLIEREALGANEVFYPVMFAMRSVGFGRFGSGRESMENWIETKSDEETRLLGRLVAFFVGPGDVLTLNGEMGAGKTHFVQGLAEGLGVAKASEVTSPTYALMNEYRGAGKALVHLDLFRIGDFESACALGLEEAISAQDKVVAIEWAETVPEIVPRKTIDLRFHVLSPMVRRVEFFQFSALEALRHAFVSR